MTASPIGVFDSGFGGLTVAREILDQLPRESVLYLGDTARTPYGPRPIAEVRQSMRSRRRKPRLNQERRRCIRS